MTHLATDSGPRLSDLGVYRQLVEALARGERVTADGIRGSFGAFLTAQLAADTDALLLYLAPTPADAVRATADLETLARGDVRLFVPQEAGRGERLALLGELLADPTGVVVSSLTALWSPVLEPAALERMALTLAPGVELAPETLVEQLTEAGYQSARMVALPGEVSRRGGIVDLYPFGGGEPLRVEYFGDEIDSIRVFDAQSQVSVRPVEGRVRIGLVGPGRLRSGGASASLIDYLPPGATRVLESPAEIERILGGGQPSATPGYTSARADRLRDDLGAGPQLVLESLDTGHGELRFGTRAPERFAGSLVAAIAGVESLVARFGQIHLYCDNAAQAGRVVRLLDEDGVGRDALVLHEGRISGGFCVPELGQAHLGYHELFGGVTDVPRRRPRPQATGPARPDNHRALDDFLKLKPGDHVVHLHHGVGKFTGLVTRERDGRAEQFLAIEYHGGTQLTLPVTQTELIQRYVGSGHGDPRLDKIGGKSWSRKKAKVSEALAEMAGDLLELQAIRAGKPGLEFPEDDELQREFEAAFLYTETVDQLSAIEAVKGDMTSPRPMDRLICGDVGYGKTEVAMRAAFKAASASMQTAVLVPTTVLAEQHYRTFNERFAGFPVRIEVVSRLRTPRQQRQTVRDAAAGQVDILIGTHRLLSKDVHLPQLGLVVIDEEQRFGVRHKGLLRRMRQTVDVVSLSATPIPRTLHMSLVGLRDISTLTTPPQARRAIETRVVPFSESLVADAIARELGRGGQVLFVHNRVFSIHERRQLLERLAPDARIGVGHGQLDDRELERVMLAFVRGELDILVATTIIESGLDIPNANTIFIDRADHFGLAELHQLRGRVGRFDRQAYAYMLADPDRKTSVDGLRRLQAIAEHSELGAGFELAMHDLEIRGAGNLLGKEQSGHIAAVGYATYCTLLEKTVAEITGQAPPRPAQLASVDLSIGATLPPEYVADEAERLGLYGRLSRVADEDAATRLGAELRDRYGALPPEAERLVRLARLRAAASRYGITLLRRTGHRVVLGGDLEPLRACEPLILPLRPIEQDTALLVLPEGVGPDRMLSLLERVFAT